MVMLKKSIYVLTFLMCSFCCANEKYQGLIEYLGEVPYLNKESYSEYKNMYEKFFGEISDIDFLKMFKKLQDIDLEGLPFSEDDLLTLN